MNIRLENLTQILTKAGISSSQEEEILIAVKDVSTPPDTTKEDLTFEELCTTYEEQLCEKKIENDEEGISGDQGHEEYLANGSCIEQWFQVSTRLD